MANRILYMLAILLMAAELKAAVYLLWSWVDQSRKNGR